MSETTARKTPMEVLVLGMCRTATQSICAAIELLGYPTIYHMKYVQSSGHAARWAEALRAKFESQGKPYGREEFDDFLGEYGGISDIPAALFAAEFIAAYPSAKVLLSIRDEDGWVKSMQDTIVHHWENHPPAPAPGASNPGLRALMRKHMWDDDFTANGREFYRRHNDTVRKLAAADQLLVFDVKQGWGPLCGFLGKNVPEEAFPRRDDWKGYREQHVDCVEEVRGS